MTAPVKAERDTTCRAVGAAAAGATVAGARGRASAIAHDE